MPVSIISNQKQIEFIVTFQELEADEFDTNQENILSFEKEISVDFIAFLENTVSFYSGPIPPETLQLAQFFFQSFFRISLENSADLTISYIYSNGVLSYKTCTDYLCLSPRNDWTKIISCSALEFSARTDASLFELTAALELSALCCV